jgi:transcriptional regulator with XRE-family HTH domain
MNLDNFSPAVERALLCAGLRQLRYDANQTQSEVARDLEWSLAKVSRIELGTSSISKTDLEALLRHYNADQQRTDELIVRARNARMSGWWGRFASIDDKSFEAYIGYEDGASSIRVWEPLLVPALLQTPEYTVQIMETWGVSPEAIELGVELRKERQRRLAARAPEQCYLLDETLLRRSVGTSVPDQLRHLALVAQKPAVTIRVVPFGIGPHFGLRGGFVLLSFDGPLDDVLYLESARRGDLLIAETKDQYAGRDVPMLDSPSGEIARYDDNFGSLMKLALDPSESLELIEGIAADMVT